MMTDILSVVYVILTELSSAKNCKCRTRGFTSAKKMNCLSNLPGINVPVIIIIHHTFRSTLRKEFKNDYTI